MSDTVRICRKARLGGVVNLLVFQPINDFEVLRVFHRIAANTLVFLQIGEPRIHQRRGIVVIGVEKAREHSRGRASAPLVIDDGEKLEKQQPGFARKRACGFRKRKLRLYRSDTSHLMSLLTDREISARSVDGFAAQRPTRARHAGRKFSS